MFHLKNYTFKILTVLLVFAVMIPHFDVIADSKGNTQKHISFESVCESNDFRRNLYNGSVMNEDGSVVSGNGFSVELLTDALEASKKALISVETEFTVSDNALSETEYSYVYAVEKGKKWNICQPVIRTLPVSHSSYPAAIQFFGANRSDFKLKYKSGSMAGARVEMMLILDVVNDKATVYCTVTESDGTEQTFKSMPSSPLSDFLNIRENGLEAIRFMMPAGSVTEYVNIDIITDYNARTVEKTNNIAKAKFFGVGESPTEVRTFINQDCNNGFFIGSKMSKNTNVDSVYLDDAKSDGAILFDKKGYSPGGTQLVCKFETSDPLVLECKIKIDETSNAKTHIFLLKSKEGVYSRNLCITSDGTLIAGTKQTAIGKINPDEWTELKAAMDFENCTFDLYVDDTVYQNIPFHRPVSDTVSWTIGWVGGDEGGDSYGKLYADNLRAYLSCEPVSPENIGRVTDYNFDTMADGEELLSDGIAFCVSSQKVSIYGDAGIKEGSSVILNDSICIEKNTSSEAFGEIAFNEEIFFEYDGKKYADVKDLAFSKGMECTVDVQRGIAFVSDDKADMLSDSWLDASDIMRYGFMKPDEIYGAFEKNAPGRPRVLVTSDDTLRIKSLYGKDDEFTVWADAVTDKADIMLNSEAVTYDEEADKSGILDKSRLVLTRILTLGTAYFISGDEKYVNRAKEEMYAACTFPDWNHFNHYLDTAEMGTALSIGYDWFHEFLTPDEKDYFENEIYLKFLNHSLMTLEDNGIGNSDFWPHSGGNWNAVCSGASALASCAVFESFPVEASYILSYTPKAVAYMERSAFPGGGWEEGSDYVTYCMKYLGFMCTTMKNSLASDMNLPSGMYDVADFMLSIDGQTGCFNFHDSHSSAVHTTSDVMSLVSRIYGRTDILNARTMAIDEYGLSPEAIDILYYLPKSECESFSLSRDLYSKPAEVFSMRSSWYDKDGVYAAIQGGKGITDHSHLDSGTFTVDIDGVRWAANLGQDSYNLPGYFGTVDERYSYYRNRPESANVYVINPRAGSYGQSVDADLKIIAQASSEDEACAVMDMTEAYSEDVTNAQRGIKLTGNRSSVVVRDEISFKKDSNEFYWFMNVPRYSALTKLDDNRYLLSKPNGASVELHIETEGISYKTVELADCRPLPTSPDPAGQNPNTGLKKLTIHGTAGDECFVNVRFTKSDVFSSDEALENWECFEFQAESDGIEFTEADDGCFNVTAQIRAKSIGEPKRAALVVAHFKGNELISIDTDCVTLDGLKSKELMVSDVKHENETLKAMVIDELVRPVGKCVIFNPEA